ncbi:MAG: hypothetical protein WEA10_05490 [Actinomycetota bacterium]
MPKVEGNYQLEELQRYYEAAQTHDGHVNRFLGRDSSGRPLSGGRRDPKGQGE